MALSEACDFLSERPQLVHEHAMGYLLLRALDLGMEDKWRDMKRVVRQKFHIKSMLDFAAARARADPQRTPAPVAAPGAPRPTRAVALARAQGARRRRA